MNTNVVQRAIRELSLIVAFDVENALVSLRNQGMFTATDEQLTTIIRLMNDVISSSTMKASPTIDRAIKTLPTR